MDTLRGMAPIVLPAINAALLALAAWRVRPIMRHWLVAGSLVLLAPVAAAVFAAPGGSGVPLLIGTAANSPMQGQAVRGGGVPAWLSIDGLTLFIALLALASTAVALGAAASGRDWPRNPVRRSVGAQLALAGSVLAVGAVNLWLMVLGAAIQTAAMCGALGHARRWKPAVMVALVSLGVLIGGVAWMSGEAGSASLADFSAPPIPGQSDATARTAYVALTVIGLGALLILPVLVAGWRVRGTNGAEAGSTRDADGDPGRAIWLGMLPAVTTFGVLMRLMIVAMESPSGFGAVLDGVQWTPLLVLLGLMLMTSGHAIALASRRLTPLVGGLALANAGLVLCPLVTASALAPILLTPAGSEPSLLATAAISQAFGAAGFWMWIMLALLTGLTVGTGVARMHTGRDDLSAAQGLGRRAPWVAVALVVALLAQIGVFPTAGFSGRMEAVRGAMAASVGGRMVSNPDTLQQLSVLVGAAFLNIALGILVVSRLGRVLMRRPLPVEHAEPATAEETAAVLSQPPAPSPLRNLLLAVSALMLLSLGMARLWADGLESAFVSLRSTAPLPAMEAMPQDANPSGLPGE